MSAGSYALEGKDEGNKTKQNTWLRWYESKRWNICFTNYYKTVFNNVIPAEAEFKGLRNERDWEGEPASVDYQFNNSNEEGKEGLLEGICVHFTSWEGLRLLLTKRRKSCKKGPGCPREEKLLEGEDHWVIFDHQPKSAFPLASLPQSPKTRKGSE